MATPELAGISHYCQYRNLCGIIIMTCYPSLVVYPTTVNTETCVVYPITVNTETCVVYPTTVNTETCVVYSITINIDACAVLIIACHDWLPKLGGISHYCQYTSMYTRFNLQHFCKKHYDTFVRKILHRQAISWLVERTTDYTHSICWHDNKAFAEHT